MEIFILIICGLLLLAGLAGSVLPVLPGPPLGYAALVLMHFSTGFKFSTTFLLLWLAVIVIIQLLDYVLSVWGTKKFGGSRAGVWGSVLGLLVGLSFGPLGIVFGPFAGALLAEMLNKRPFGESMRAAMGSLVGFLLGTTLKLVASGLMIFYFVEKLIVKNELTI